MASRTSSTTSNPIRTNVGISRKTGRTEPTLQSCRPGSTPFFSRYSDAKWDLWRGGTVKSNSTRPFLWREVWGEDWAPAY